MEHLWIIIALTAAFVQTLRNGLMKHLKNELPDRTIVFSRFAFSIPFACLWFFIIKILGYDTPDINNAFLTNILIAAICQSCGAYLFLALFGRRNFITGIIYAKTETLQAALFGALLFSEFINLGALIAIIIGFSGIVAISVVEKHLEPKKLWQRVFTKSAIIGLASGALFGLTVVFTRQAIISLEGNEFFVNASFTLIFMLTLPALISSVPAFWKNPNAFKKLINLKRKAILVGLLNSISTFGWFVAFSLANASYVSMVGQTEILFSIFFTHKIFKEKIETLEMIGILMVVTGIIILVYFG